MNKALPYIVLAAVLVPLAAHAQIVGGAPETALTAIAAWLQGPVGRPLITIGFILVGITMMVGRHTLEGLVFCVLGATFYAGAGGLAQIMVGGG